MEREARFEQADKKLDDVCLEIAKFKKPFLRKLNEFPSIEKYSENANELFFVGGHLGGLVSGYLTFFEKWLRDGKSLKFLLQNPANEGLKHLVMPCYGYDYAAYKSQIETALERLHKLKLEHEARLATKGVAQITADQPFTDKYKRGSIDIKIYDMSPTQTLAILDGNIGGTTAYIGLHIPYGDAVTRPYIILNKREHEEPFNLFYSRYYIELWDDSETYKPSMS